MKGAHVVGGPGEVHEVWSGDAESAVVDMGMHVLGG